jgi:PIN domain nuclease of toxin-antitoxin system
LILLDTHALVWLASDPEQLSAASRDAILAHADSLYCSVVSTWEMALLVEKGRLLLPMDVDVFVERAIERHGLMELPLDRDVILASVALPDIHTDPFDRILIAECGRRRLSLVSRDRLIPTYPEISVVW